MFTSATAFPHTPQHRGLRSVICAGADLHFKCITLKHETAPVHTRAHGPIKPNGQHQQLLQVNIISLGLTHK